MHTKHEVRAAGPFGTQLWRHRLTGLLPQLCLTGKPTCWDPPMTRTLPSGSTMTLHTHGLGQLACTLCGSPTRTAVHSSAAALTMGTCAAPGDSVCSTCGGAEQAGGGAYAPPVPVQVVDRLGLESHGVPDADAHASVGQVRVPDTRGVDLIRCASGGGAQQQGELVMWKGGKAARPSSKPSTVHMAAHLQRTID